MTKDQINYKFISKLDTLLRERNRAIIDPMIPELTEETVDDLIDFTAAVRGAYLKQYYDLTRSHKGDTKLPTAKEIKDLKATRRLYTEMTEAFQALQTAIERGYLTVESE